MAPPAQIPIIRGWQKGSALGLLPACAGGLRRDAGLLPQVRPVGWHMPWEKRARRRRSRPGRQTEPTDREAAGLRGDCPWGFRAPNRCHTPGAPSVHELLSGPASHPAAPRRPGDRGGHRLPRRARPAHHRAPVGRRAGRRAAGAGRPVAGPGRGAVLTHPGGRGARRAGWLRASGARTRAQPAGAGGGPGGVLGEAAGGTARGPGRAAAGHRPARARPGPLHSLLGGGAALTLGARHVG